MTYRVWEGINKHESHWAVRKRRRMTPISVHREKRRGRITRKGEEEQTRGKTPLTVRKRKEAAQKCNRTRSEPSDSSF